MSTTNIQPELSGLPALSAGQRLVVGALVEIPDATVKVLAEATGTSKSTVAKTLLKLEQAGAARRTLHEDGDTRFADTWSPTVLTGAVLVTSAEAPDNGHATALSSARPHGSAGAASEQLEFDRVVDADEVGASEITHGLDAADSMSPIASEDACRPGSEKPDAVEGEDSDTVAREYVPDDGSGDHSAVDGAEDSCTVLDAAPAPAEPIRAPAGLPAQDAASSSRERLAPGVLGTMVAAHLMAHPEMDFTPTELSHVLGGRSSGAIYNALVKMKNAATVIQTCESPRRFRHAPSAEAA